MKYLSLFSGIGGFELGITQAYENLRRTEQEVEERPDSGDALRRGIETRQQGIPHCIGFSEIDKYATQIYQRHFPEHKNYGDITKIKEAELPDFDLLVGGFPCQSFSIAGKRGGFADTRGTLFFDIARILKHKQPRLLLLENVKGLLSHDEGRTFATIIATLDELGYDLQWQVLNSKNHGVPQNRERVFIVGHLRGTSRPKVFPIGEGEKNDNRETGIANTLSVNYWKGVGASRPFVQENGDFPDNTNTIRRATYSLDSRIRRLTPTECERLQGFPDGWTEGISDTQRYKCLGNAVTVNVIQAVMEKLSTGK